DDEKLWTVRCANRRALVGFVRERLPAQLAAAGLPEPAAAAVAHVFDGDALTLGLARRFTSYKRPGLLLHDPERLARLLCDARRPVQIVVAGKAHPRDEEGKALVARWIEFVRRPDVRPRAVFLADYDLRLAERMVQGVDLWINTPRPPLEACGTSGMKVLVNGGLNLSSLDGWWAEAHSDDVGWALPPGARSDGEDASALYELLEREVVPAFYSRDASGLPRAWVAKMRASMSTLAGKYSSNRALRDYVDRFYVPGAREHVRRAASGCAAAVEMTAAAALLRELFSSIRFGDVTVAVDGARQVLSVAVYVDDIAPDLLAVELCADATADSPAVALPMRRGAPLVGAHGFTFSAEVPTGRAAADCTPRVVPRIAGMAVPLELPLVRWQR
ncbi:MAG TPA: alpha-glucan family phosphorylase, partial [Minicystis sp.]|nr:alpha-glucan family phosphorylase [Minicystis sp.]